MNKEVYKHLLRTYGCRSGIWVGFIAEIIGATIMRVYVVVLLAGMVSSITIGDVPRAKHYVILYICLALSGSLLRFAGNLVSRYTECEVYKIVSIEYYKKLLGKDMSFFRNNHTGTLTTMYTRYVDTSIVLLRLITGEFVRTTISLSLPAIVLFYASPKIGLIAFMVIISQMVYMFWASSKAQVYRQRSNELYKEFTGEVADDITNALAYKSAGMERSALKRMQHIADEEAVAFWRRFSTIGILDLPRNIATITLTALSFWVILNSRASTGDTVKLLVLTLTYMFQIFRNVGDLPDLIANHDDLVTKLHPTLAILKNMDEVILDPVSPVLAAKSNAEIHIDHISFKYTEESKTEYVLKDFDLKILAGEHVGVVGLSGAGKSTLASLIMRFDEVNSGAIRINGVDIRDVAQSDLRRSIGYVPQEPLLFHRTIRENIAYLNEVATDEQIITAAKAAHAYDFITVLPNKFETIVGERGVKLSGGQKQRVVITRAILKNAPVLLFDEATSALDSESEQIIQKSLPKIIGNHTALIIAHRLSTVAGLDRIIVMHNGQIEEQGTHKELLSQKGRYYSLWQKQTSGV